MSEDKINEEIEDKRLKRKKLMYNLVIGLFLIAIGIYTYYDFASWEQSGGTRKINRTLYSIYKMGGKEGAMYFFISVGLIYWGVGFYKFTKKPKQD